MIKSNQLARLGLALTTFVGALLLGRLLLSHYFGGAYCPPIGGVPACGYVFVAYLVAFAFAVFPIRVTRLAFFPAAAIIIIFALGGVAQELRNVGHCPRSLHVSVPDCYVAVVLAVMLLAFSFAFLR